MSIYPKFKAQRQYDSPVGFVFDQEEKEKLEKHLSRFSEGDPLELTVKKYSKKRTSGQPDEETNFNGYYWGVIVKIVADEIGEVDLGVVDEWIQQAVGNVRGMPDGKVVTKGTSWMSGAEFSDYCRRARMWASEYLQCYIPQPHEAEWEQ